MTNGSSGSSRLWEATPTSSHPRCWPLAAPLVPVFRHGRPFYEYETAGGRSPRPRFPKLVVSGGHQRRLRRHVHRPGATTSAHVARSIEGAGHEIQFTGEPINQAFLDAVALDEHVVAIRGAPLGPPGVLPRWAAAHVGAITGGTGCLRRVPESEPPVVSRHRNEVGPTVGGNPSEGCGSRCGVCRAGSVTGSWSIRCCGALARESCWCYSALLSIWHRS